MCGVQEDGLQVHQVEDGRQHRGGLALHHGAGGGSQEHGHVCHHRSEKWVGNKNNDSALFEIGPSLVPIIEPDISREGSHSVERNMAVTELVLATVYKALSDYSVYLEGTVLKPSMVTSGTKCAEQASPDHVAQLTLLGENLAISSLSHDPLSPLPPCPARRPRGVLPQRRSDRGDGHRQPEGHQQERGPPDQALAHLLLLRPGAAGQLQGRLARQGGEGEGGPAGLHDQAQTQWRGSVMTAPNKDYILQFDTDLDYRVTICNSVGWT